MVPQEAQAVGEKETPVLKEGVPLWCTRTSRHLWGKGLELNLKGRGSFLGNLLEGGLLVRHSKSEQQEEAFPW